jgi:hypothetical protein
MDDDDGIVGTIGQYRSFSNICGSSCRVFCAVSDISSAGGPRPAGKDLGCFPPIGDRAGLVAVTALFNGAP